MSAIKQIIKFISQVGLGSSVYKRRVLLSTPEFKELKKYPNILSWFSLTSVFSGDYIHDKKINFIYNPQTDIGNLLYKTGQFEDLEIIFSSQLLESFEAGTVLDIGANVGVHVISWAKKNEKHFFYAFEPTRAVFGVLSQSIKNNKLSSRVSAISKAVSNKRGTAQFFETSDDAYNSLKDTQRKNVNFVYDVNVISVDDFVSENKIEDLRFVKIDTEGFEDEVISGASDTIKKFMPDFFIEIYKGVNSNANPEATIQKMISHGYNAYVFKNGKLETYINHNDQIYNYFFSKRLLI